MVGVGGADDESKAVDRDHALGELHRDHYRSLVRLARLLVDDEASGEDIVQDAFVSMFNRWDRVEDPVKYLRVTVMNGARSGLRRRRIARRYIAPGARSAPGADEVVVAQSEHAEVLDAVRTLPRRQRECLVLRYYADLSEVDVAATLGISVGSVKSHSHRGITALTRVLGAES